MSKTPMLPSQILTDEKVEDIFLFPATSLGKREVTLLSRKPRGICKVTPNEINS